MKKLFSILCVFSVIVILIPAHAAQAQLRAQALPPTTAAVPAQNLSQDIAARSRDLSRLLNRNSSPRS